MKPDGVTMETTEPTEAAVLADVTEEVPSQPDVATAAAPKANDEPLAADQKVKPKTSGSKTQSSAGASGSSLRVGSVSHRTVNDVKSSVAATGNKKMATTTSKASAAGAVPKRPVAVAAVSVAAKNQTKVLDKRPVGPARSLPDATVTNGAKPKTLNGSSKRPAAEASNGARPKPTATANKTVTSKSNTSTTRPGTASSKTTRAATNSASPVATNKFKSTAAATKPSNTAASKTAATSRVATTSSTGKTLVLSPKSSAAAKKDVSRPLSAAVAKKLTTAPVSTKRPEPSKPTATGKLNSAPKGSTATKTTDAKVPQSKAHQTAKPAARFPSTTKPALARSQPASPANKPISSSSPMTKRGTKPILTVPPFTTKVVKNAKIPAERQSAACAETAAEAVGSTERPEATVASQQESSLAASAVEDVSTQVPVQQTTAEVKQPTVAQSDEAAPSKSPVRTTAPRTSPAMEQLDKSTMSVTMQEQVSSAAKLPAPLVASPADLLQEDFDLLKDQTLSKSADLMAAGASTVAQAAPAANLNEEEDEEEREGSQQVSVSEMSGTTQPTEESRPGSGGPVGGSAWRAGGALLSELDSEEVSGSQQGASELSAPGVLEGTESTDDLGDGSLKGAIDMEGASAGSPDFEKVPDIPANDYDDDEDEDDSDRVCDMDVGSERTDGPQGPRHDNDVDEEDDDDDDVEMASEGVTESGLESYGNADEDDFAEDERLDNLNRFAQPPPPPPVLPAAPAAQWDQPNPFTDPWAEPLQSHQVLDSAQVAAVASPLGDPSQVDSDTPTQTPPQAWQELGSAHFAPEQQDIPHHSSVMCRSQNAEAQFEQSMEAAVGTQTLPAFSAPRMSSSNTLSSPEVKLQSCAAQATVHSPRLDLDCPGLDIDLKRGDKEMDVEAEPETLPADEAFEGPATAPTSNPSSSSVTEDEASDTEGETQLDSLESPVAANVTFDCSSLPKRCLSTVEEREEAEMEEVEVGAGKEVTPPSAASLTSYGSDSIATASSSIAQSTGDSCTKSPGIFSLEELPEEAKEAGFIQPPHIQQSDTDEPYIECRKQEADAAEHVNEGKSSTGESLGPSAAWSDVERLEDSPDDTQPLYYSICEKTEDSFAGFTALPHPHRRDHLAHPRIYCDIVKPHGPAVTSAKLSCADLPPRSPGQQARSPQLRRLEQHQRQLLELQQRREQQSRPLEEAEQERKRRAEEEERKKKEEAEEEIKRNKEEEETKKNEERKAKNQALVKQKEEEELKQKQQILQWQQELQQSDEGQTALPSPSSGLCTIYEALENSEEEAEHGGVEHIPTVQKEPQPETKRVDEGYERVRSHEDEHRDFSQADCLPPDSTESSPTSPQDDNDDPPCPPESPVPSPPLDLDWEKKVDIVQQLINQTLLLNGDSCSSLLLLPGGAGGTLSPLESSLWPNLLPPLTPPSATVTSVSSFSPEATGSAPQGEWTVVELETHH